MRDTRQMERRNGSLTLTHSKHLLTDICMTHDTLAPIAQWQAYHCLVGGLDCAILVGAGWAPLGSIFIPNTLVFVTRATPAGPVH
jgi:hypothetical protein